MIDDSHFSTSMDLHVGYRFPHNCPTGPGRDKPLVVTRIETGWKWFCHRCHEKGIKWAAGLSPAEWLKFNAARPIQENSVVSKVTLPHGFTLDIPVAGLAWLYQYDLSDDEIKKYGIGYSTTLKRVILPVYNKEGILVYYQGRNLAPKSEWTPKNPKYMNVKARGRKDLYFTATSAASPMVTAVVVEDIISAIRVGRHTDAYGLLNAYIPDDLIRELCKVYPKVILWLDPDKHDRMIGKVIRYRSLGMNVKMVRAFKDPKAYTDDEISDKLEGL